MMIGERFLRPLVVGCMVVLSATVLPAWAQEPEVPACLRVDYPQPTVPEFGHTEALSYSTQETQCWVDVVEARRAGGMALDVREAAVAPLPGAVALPLPSVADRRYLRDQPLTLVGTGVDLRALTTACLSLRKQGFSKVQVLLGGARSWVQIQSVDMVTPQEAWLGALDGQWRLIGIGLPQEQVQSLVGKPEVNLPSSVDDAALVQALNDAERARPLGSHQQWLLLTPNQASGQSLLARLQQTPYKPGARALAWLSGGWDSYNAYLQQQQQSAAHAGRPLPRSCGS